MIGKHIFSSVNYCLLKHIYILHDRPLLTFLHRRAQSDRWSNYRQTGVVHRITYSFSDFVFYLCFIYSFYSWYKIMARYIQLNNQIMSSKLTQSLLCTPSHHTHKRLFSQCPARVRYQLPTASPFEISPLLPITNGPQYTVTDKPGHEGSVTDASKPKIQIY